MNPPARLFFLSALVLLASCAVEVGPPHEELAPDYDTTAQTSFDPPLPKRNVAAGEPVPETSAAVRVEGYWAKHPWGWTWVPAVWVPLPRPGSVWIDAHWECRPRIPIWIPGYWQ